MRTYLRFGEIPENEQSINYFSHKLEKGVSVFEIENNMPLISNMNLVSSLAVRINANIYEVSGDVVGIGNDGEPLLKNIVVLRKLNISKEEISEYILKILINSFEIARGQDDKNFDSRVSNFAQYRKQNKISGEIETYFDWLKSDDEKYINLGEFEIFSYRFIDFEKPVEGFNAHMGYIER